MLQDDIVRKVHALLELAGNNSNEHEAALAAAKAQDLMLKHDLSMADVEGHQGKAAPISEADGYSHLKVPVWKSGLFAVVAETSNCAAYVATNTVGYKSNGSRMRKQTLRLVGRENDVAVASYVFDYLVRELDRLAEAYTRTVRTYGVRGALKHKRESWYLGAVSTVCATLRAQYLERTKGADANALVVVKDEAVAKYMEDAHGRLRKTYRARRAIDGEAYRQGLADGQTIGVNPAVKGGAPAARHQIGG